MGEKNTALKLGIGKQLGYAWGEMAGQCFFGFWGTFLSVYYTDVVGLAPAIVSIIFMAARIWDAINDPMMGAIADRHRHKKYGRYRPWILYGVPVLAVLSILVFRVPNLNSQSMKIVYVTITYILAGMAYTAVNVPYTSLQSTITTDVQSRNNLAGIRSAFTFIGTAIINLFTAGLIARLAKFDSVGKGYFLTAVIFTALGVLLYYMTFANTKEVYFPEPQETKASFKEILAYIFGNKVILLIILATLLSTMATFGRLGVAIYYYMYDLHAFEMIGLLMVLPSLGAIIPSYLVPKIRLPRKTLILAALAGRAISLIALYFVDFNNIKAVIVCLAFVGICNCETGLLFGLLAPAIDDTEVRTNKRMDATVFAMGSFAAKVASAIGGSIGLLVMGAMGYVANAEQTATSMKGINIATNIVPAICCILAMIPVFLFPLTEDKVRENSEILAKRHAGQE